MEANEKTTQLQSVKGGNGFATTYLVVSTACVHWKDVPRESSFRLDYDI